MSPLPPEILAELQKDYLDSLTTKASEAEILFQAKNWPALQDLFHKTAGSGATYQMPEISVLSRCLEYYIKLEKQLDEALLTHGLNLYQQAIQNRKSGQTLDVTKEPLIVRLSAMIPA